MIHIVKKHEPKELKEYRESESCTGVRPTYDSMSSDLHEYVLSKLVEEQGRTVCILYVQNSRNRQKNREYIEVYD